MPRQYINSSDWLFINSVCVYCCERWPSVCCVHPPRISLQRQWSQLQSIPMDEGSSIHALTTYPHHVNTSTIINIPSLLTAPPSTPTTSQPISCLLQTYSASLLSSMGRNTFHSGLLWHLIWLEVLYPRLFLSSVSSRLNSCLRQTQFPCPFPWQAP